VQAVLVVQRGPNAGTTFRLAGEETLIGRSPQNHVALSDDGASREHALVLFDEATGSFTLEDLQSTNGTRVNQKRVHAVTLHHGDEIQIGQTVLRFALLD
jgi:pSer/pThr/pTyr-binding forkhead associated (FHA) protein